jgi:hypothetical protein
MRIDAALSEFRLSGNFFRATASGGVLESQDAALELGEEYFYVSQRALAEPYPQALKISERKENRGWLAYRVLLRDSPHTRTEDLAGLRRYLCRSVVPPQPRMEIVWPPAYRFDADGTARFVKATKQLVVRSDHGPPYVETGGGAKIPVENLGEGLYEIRLNAHVQEIIVWISPRAVRRLHFEDVPSATPRGVVLTVSSGSADLASVAAAAIAGQSGAIEISVPSERLWRNARINGKRLSPLPNGENITLEGPLQDVRFGAFGSVFAMKPFTGGVGVTPWYSRVQHIVAASVGRAAVRGLASIHSKHQAVRWAAANNATLLLPLVLSAFVSEVNRGVS